MLVSDETFAGLVSSAKEIKTETNCSVRVPSLDNLFALKLHALKYGPQQRDYKDIIDIISLADANGIDVRGDKFRQLCERYGSTVIYERILAFSSQV
jgi:hypothetical protein